MCGGSAGGSVGGRLIGSPRVLRLSSRTFRIDNFGKVNDNYYRGAQPEDHYTDLAALGVRTVIDLTRDGRADEQGFVERSGNAVLSNSR